MQQVDQDLYFINSSVSSGTCTNNETCYIDKIQIKSNKSNIKICKNIFDKKIKK